MSILKPIWKDLQDKYYAGAWDYPLKELMYSVCGIIKECDQKLDGGYMAPDYIMEKAQAIARYAAEIQGGARGHVQLGELPDL